MSFPFKCTELFFIDIFKLFPFVDEVYDHNFKLCVLGFIHIIIYGEHYFLIISAFVMGTGHVNFLFVFCFVFLIVS